MELERVGHRFGVRSDVLIRRLAFFEDNPRGTPKELQDTIGRVLNDIDAQILYLPTYRRIERELGSIFEGVNPEDFRRNRVRLTESAEAYIELVEFGMKDVQEAVGCTLDHLKEFARESLTNLTLKYLGDVVNQEYRNVGMKEIADVSEDTVHAVLTRIHESILTKEHKNHVLNVINSARANDAPTEHERIIYHYFLKLLGFQESLQEHERQIRAFCGTCSRYITDKHFLYDSQTFTFTIDFSDSRSKRAKDRVQRSVIW